MDPATYVQTRRELKATVLQEELHFQLSTDAAYERGKVDFSFYAGLLLREVYETAFPPFYI